LALTRGVIHRHPDFREGVRAVLVDKGTPPARWTPESIEAVDMRAVQGLF